MWIQTSQPQGRNEWCRSRAGREGKSADRQVASGRRMAAARSKAEAPRSRANRGSCQAARLSALRRTSVACAATPRLKRGIQEKYAIKRCYVMRRYRIFYTKRHAKSTKRSKTCQVLQPNRCLRLQGEDKAPSREMVFINHVQQNQLTVGRRR